MRNIKDFIKNNFGVDPNLFMDLLDNSPSAKGYIIGAAGEEVFKNQLEDDGFEVFRIKEKPAGGYNAKTEEARGDFYIRESTYEEAKAYVIECKGLKSNSEFRGARFEKRENVFRYLKTLAFPPENYKQKTYDSGKNRYEKKKETWSKKNPGKAFPPFNWDLEHPGANNADLRGIWSSVNELREWVNSQPDELFTEEAFRSVSGVITILETHKPSIRIGKITGIKQAAPLVDEFSILSVDLFIRTGKHEFVYMNPRTISHSPTSPEHLYQNYTIDVLVNGLKTDLNITYPWYRNIRDCISETEPDLRDIDETQLDNRGEDGEEIPDEDDEF